MTEAALRVQGEAWDRMGGFNHQGGSWRRSDGASPLQPEAFESGA